MHTQTPHTLSTTAALAERITHRRAMFLPGGVADADLDALADADEADLHAIAVLPPGSHADQRAKAAVLAHRDLSGGMSLGEAALLRSLLSDLTCGRHADPLRTHCGPGHSLGKPGARGG